MIHVGDIMSTGGVFSTVGYSNNKIFPHGKKLYKPFSRLKIRSQFFSQRVIDEWNSLPNSVVSSVSLSDFKRNYDTYNGDKNSNFEENFN